MGNWMMKTSQLFLCQKFTRLHVTKSPALPLIPPLTWLLTKQFISKWIVSHKPSLTHPPMAWQRRWDSVKPRCLWKSTHMRATTAVLWSRAGNWNVHCDNKPSRNTHFFFLPLWLGGCRAMWLLSADTFQLFSLCGSFLANFLGQTGTLPRTSLL